jgi:hypothetical protein
MPIKHAFLVILLSCAFLKLGLEMSPALADGVVLEADTWDSICRIEVTKGRFEEPSLNQLVFSGSVLRDWTYSTADSDSVCYRRSNDPVNCASGLSSYSCTSRNLDGQTHFSLQ